MEQAVNDDHAEIKKRAMQRLFVAGALVAAAVIALTVLSNKPDEHTTSTNAPKTPAIATPEPTPPETAQEITAAAADAHIPDEPPVPDSEAAPATPPPPPPQVVNKPNQATLEAASKESSAPEKASEPQAVTISPVPAAKKPAGPMAAESKPAVAATAPPVKTAETVAPKGYVVQLGLFSNHENAVQLQKRLADHGIKSYTETRLHVGPFQNKTDADQALKKIHNMGINAVLVPAR